MKLPCPPACIRIRKVWTWWPSTASGIAAALLLFASGEAAFAQSGAYSESIDLAVSHWLAVQKPPGFLPYGFDFLDNLEAERNSLSAPNLTRQTAAAAVLADYYALTGDPRANPAIQRFLQAFARHSLPISKSRTQELVESTRVLSLPFGRYKIRDALNRLGLLYEARGPGKVLSPTSDYSKAYTGAVALALLTELRYSQASGDNRFAPLRQAWLEGLIGLHVPGEGFRQYPTSIETTPYFDGEAWLALAQYHRTFPQDQRVGKLLDDVDAEFMQKYGRTFRIDFYHWGAMAAAARFADTQDRQFLDFLKGQTDAFLGRRAGRPDSNNNCAWIEGVADAVGALAGAGEGRGALARRAMGWIGTEMHKAGQLQIQPGQRELVFADARIVAPRMQEFSGCFRAGTHAAYTQVDFTAHCVSAMVKLARYKLTPAGN